LSASWVAFSSIPFTDQGRTWRVVELSLCSGSRIM
jgi:hypothetical protein